MKIKIPVSCGELIDKITILEIKYINIECKEKQEHVWKELEELFYIYNNKISCIDKCKKYKDDLSIINNELNICFIIYFGWYINMDTNKWSVFMAIF